MRYRWKVLLLIVTIVVMPLMAGRLLGVNAFDRLGRVFISQTRDFLTEDAKNQLKQAVDSYAAMLALDDRHLELALSTQAAGIERLLSDPGPPPGPVRFVEDFQAAGNPPPDLAVSSVHFKTDPDGTSRLLRVSYGSPVFRYLPVSAKPAAEAHLRKLAGVGPVFRKVARVLETRVIWQYTVMDSGVFCAYPGYGALSEKFTPRTQPWYRRVLQTGRSSWSSEYADPETGRMVTALGMPVRDRSGGVAGVTAIVVPVNALLERMLFLKNIPSDTRPFVVHLVENPETGKTGALIVARGDTFPMAHSHQPGGMHKEWLTADDAEQMDQIMGDFELGGNNTRRVFHNGIDTLWVYGRVDNRTLLVLVTPYARIVERASRAEKAIQAQMDRFLRNTRYGGALVLLVAVALAVAFSRTVSKPLQLLAEGARRLGSGDFDVRVDIRSKDEFGTMGRVFNQVVPRLKEHLQMGQSLHLAREVQQNLLPRRAPESETYSIGGATVYCEGTGGDYYDFIPFCGELTHAVGVAVGDVAGHGVSSALLMTTARALIRQRSRMPGAIAAVVNDVNRCMVDDVGDSGQFVTLFYGCLDQHPPTIQWVCAGHDPAVVFDPETDAFAALGGAGLPLGVLADAGCRQYEKTLSAGMIVAVGTDGIWETRNARGEMFGRRRFRQVIRAHQKADADAIVAAVLDAVTAFRAGAEQEDDVTLVVIKVKG